MGELIHEVRQSGQTNSEGAEGGGDQRTEGMGEGSGRVEGGD